MSFNFKHKKRIIIKIGSALLIEDQTVRADWLESLAQDIKFLKDNFSLEIIIVSSGSVALGRQYIKTKNRKLNLQEKQAAAAVGQISLMAAYKTCFAKYNINVAQILLTGGEANNRQRYLNARASFNSLLQNNILPIVNENDSVTNEEIKIGDNDRLAARVAQMTAADLLILLSDVDGLYNKNPKIYKDAVFIEKVEKISKEIENMASGSNSASGTGGMVTKIQAAKMAFNSGCDTVISQGFGNNPITRLVNGGRHTVFKCSALKRINSRKQWIVDILNPKGEVIINECAKEALLKGSSLLPVGVEAVKGDFTKEDQVLIKDIKGNHIATGLINYSKKDAEIIIGKKTAEIKKNFGKDSKEELIHRDNMVVII